MYKFVFYSHLYHFPPVATRLQDKGYQVLFADMTKDQAEPDEPNKSKTANQEEAKRQQIGDGMIKRMPADEVTAKLLSLKEAERKDYLIFFDFNHGFQYGEKLKKAGFKGLFSDKWGYLLERDRDASTKLVEKLYPDVKVPETKKFSKGQSKQIDEFIKTDGRIWVIKPDAEEVGVFCPLSHDPSIAYEECRSHIEDNRKGIDGCTVTLQEKIIGKEINIETGYCEGKPLWCAVDMENKPMLNAEQGSQTGCVYDVCFYIPLKSPIRMITNEPFDKIALTGAKLKGKEPIIIPAKLTTIMDMNCIISDKDGSPYFVEFCPNRMGYNAFFTCMTILGEENIDKFLIGWVNGTFSLPDGIPNKFAASLRNFNIQQDKMFYESLINKDFKNSQIKIKDHKGVWLWDAYKKDGKYYMANNDKNTLIVTAVSDTPEGAVIKVQRKADKEVDYEGQYFREDFDEFEQTFNPVYRTRYLIDRKLT